MTAVQLNYHLASLWLWYSHEKKETKLLISLLFITWIFNIWASSYSSLPIYDTYCNVQCSSKKKRRREETIWIKEFIYICELFDLCMYFLLMYLLRIQIDTFYVASLIQSEPFPFSHMNILFLYILHLKYCSHVKAASYV